MRPTLSFCPFRNKGRDSSEHGCAGESPAGVFRMREEVLPDHGAYPSSPTELPEPEAGIGYSRHEKIPLGNPPAFESDGSGCRTGDRQAGGRKTSCRTEDTVREGNVPPEFSPAVIRITAVTEVRLRIFSGNFPENKTENKRENACAFSLRFFPVICYGFYPSITTMFSLSTWN